ncbi:MAG: hypothetical protein WC028_25000 [Candidatus Obscuribacterales bacterium]
MSPHKFMRFLVLLLLLAVTASGITYEQFYRQDWFGFAPQAAESAAQGGANNALKNRVSKTNIFPFLQGMLNKLPAPTNLDANRFDQVLGIDAGNYLRTANVSRIEVVGDLFNLSLTKVSTTNLNGQADLRVAQKVTFTYQKVASPTGSHIVFSNIDGVEVKATWLLGWMTVSQVDVSLDAAGNTVLVVTVDTFFGKTDRTFTIGPDGKPHK